MQSADADQHRDRITRFGLLKHRAKLQEQYLWTQVDFNSGPPTEESIEALKAAIKLKECGQFLQFRNYYTVDQIKLVKLITVTSICFVLSVLVFVLLGQ